jgi:transcriptional regulator with XRE-family HTH domain
MKTPNQSYNLVHALREVAARNNKRQADVARATGFNHVFVSRVFNGTQPNLSSTELEKICDVVCKTKEDWAVVIRAFLLDQLGDMKNSDTIEIVIPGEEDVATPAIKRRPLDPKFREALAQLTELGVKHLEVAEFVSNLVRAFKRFGG